MSAEEIAEGNSYVSSQDDADMLALISPVKSASPEVLTKAQNLYRAVDHSSKKAQYRHPVHWRVAVVNKSDGKNDIYHGRTNDVSLSSLRILLERNAIFTSDVVVLLAIPPQHEWEKETIVEIECSATCTVLESEHSQFRLGMKYIRFKGNGKNILSDVLLKRPIPKQEPKSY